MRDKEIILRLVRAVQFLASLYFNTHLIRYIDNTDEREIECIIDDMQYIVGELEKTYFET